MSHQKFDGTDFLLGLFLASCLLAFGGGLLGGVAAALAGSGIGLATAILLAVDAYERSRRQ